MMSLIMMPLVSLCFVPFRGLVSSMFSLYRMIVLPIANTWMSWSLLHKLQWDPTPPLLGGLGLIMTLFLFVGLKVLSLMCYFVKILSFQKSNSVIKGCA